MQLVPVYPGNSLCKTILHVIASLFKPFFFQTKNMADQATASSFSAQFTLEETSASWEKWYHSKHWQNKHESHSQQKSETPDILML